MNIFWYILKSNFDFLGVKKGSCILDVGCGNGDQVYGLIKFGYKSYGIDVEFKEGVHRPELEKNKIIKLIDIGSASRASLDSGDVYGWPTFDDKIDVIVSRAVIEHVRNLGEFVLQQIKDHTCKIALALKTKGLINIQYAIKNDKVYVIEANPRASRTVPFIAKAYDEPYVNYAAKVMLGEKKVKDFNFTPRKKGYAIKIPVFSYEKFPDVKKELGPEMKSTGEAIRFIDDLKDPFFRKIYSERNMHLSR